MIFLTIVWRLARQRPHAVVSAREESLKEAGAHAPAGAGAVGEGQREGVDRGGFEALT